MSTIERIIHRPVLATVMSLIIIIFGLVGYERLSLRRYPDVSNPTVTVEIKLEGASSMVMEKMVTTVLEKALLGLEGLKGLSSVSTEGTSRVTINFNRGYDIDKAVIDVRNRTGRVRSDLPHDIQPIQVTKTDLEDRPIIWLTLTSDRQKIEDLADYAKVFLTNKLEAVPGVAKVDVAGASNYQVKILLDPLKMASHNVTVSEVMDAVHSQHVKEPGGSIDNNFHKVTLTIDAKLHGEEDFNNLIIQQNDDYIIRLRDIGKAEIVARNKTSISIFDGKKCVSISVKKQATANQLEIVDKILGKLPNMRRYLPTGAELKIAHDNTISVRSSIKEVKKTIFEAFLLVSIIVLLIFGSIRAAFIPVVTIPISLIGACFCMYLLGFSLNLLTLLAFVLAIGLVVDDAIVVLENIHRYIEKGMPPLKAAIKGTTEIQFAVIAMTFTLAAVYAPLAIAKGLVGALFREFAITLVITVLISGFVALTLSPVMCAKLLKFHLSPLPSFNKDNNDQHNPDTTHNYTNFSIYNFLTRGINFLDTFLAKMQVFVDKVNTTYSNTLKFVMATYINITIIVGITFAVIGGFVSWQLTSKLFPKEDLGYLTMTMLSPNSFTLERTLKYIREINKKTDNVKEVQGNLVSVRDVGRSTFFVSLKDWRDRTRSSHEIVDSMRKSLDKLPVNLVIQGSINPFSSGEGDSVYAVVKGRASDEAIEIAVQKLLKFFNRIPGVKQANTFSNSGREIKVSINREKAALLGIKTSAITKGLATLWKGKLGGKYSHNDRQVDIIVSLDDKYKSDIDILSSLFLKGRKGKEWVKVPISELVEFVPIESLTSISRYNGVKGQRLMVKLKEGASLGDIIDEMQDIATDELEGEMQMEFIGEAKQYKEEQSNFYLVFLLAIIIIYLVLAAQYESYYDPILIMMSVPLSVAGAMITLKITGGSLNIYSKIGMVTLIGLITKHSIMIVEFANQLQTEGMSKLKAALTACELRFRPILITTLAMVLGALPLALASGAGMESRQQIGWVIVGGMSFGTIFTLFFIPSIYAKFGRNLNKTNQIQ